MTHRQRRSRLPHPPLPHSTAALHCRTPLPQSTAALHCRTPLPQSTAAIHCRNPLPHSTGARTPPRWLRAMLGVPSPSPAAPDAPLHARLAPRVSEPSLPPFCGHSSVDTPLWTLLCGHSSVDTPLWTLLCGHSSVDALTAIYSSLRAISFCLPLHRAALRAARPAARCWPPFPPHLAAAPRPLPAPSPQLLQPRRAAAGEP